MIPFQLYELLFVRHVYPSTARGVATSMTFNAVYISWVFVIAQVGGFWVYPVLEVLDPVQGCWVNKLLGFVKLYTACRSRLSEFDVHWVIISSCSSSSAQTAVFFGAIRQDVTQHNRK